MGVWNGKRSAVKDGILTVTYSDLCLVSILLALNSSR